MKLFFSPCPPGYTTYTFPYGIYAIPQHNSELSELYNSSFLPYTGDTNLKYPVFYKARSLRVALEKFSDSSENRRIARKFDDMNFRIEELGNEFQGDGEFKNFAIDYAEKRFKGGQMDAERLDYVLSRTYLTHVYRFLLNEKCVAYLLAVENKSIFHYWFCFFDLEIAAEMPLGKYLMWKGIHIAKDKGCSYVYLGTCYGNRSLYKARDFKGVEFHDGNFWSSDLNKLKLLCKTDEDVENHLIADEFKLSEDPNKLVETILSINN